MTNTKKPMQQPIGYWLNRTDQALTKAMNNVLQAFGITRIGWQILNVLHQHASLSEEEVYALLEANADHAELVNTVDDLVVRGWVERTKQAAATSERQMRLTEEGRATHEQLQSHITQFRQRSLQGISAEECQTAVHVLERIVRNLE